MIRFRQRRRAVRGLPEGLSLELLSSVCQEAFCSTPQHSSYLQLSGWKGAGAYRLFLRLENQRELSLIFKNAAYGEADIPALAGFPVSPGPPEYLVAGIRSGPLRKFLPTTYWQSEVQPREKYFYLSEDLGSDFYCLSASPNLARDQLAAARQLPAVHRALEESLPGRDLDYLISFDRNFSTDLVTYAGDSLGRYLAVTNDASVRRIIDKWSEVCGVYLNDRFFTGRPVSYIHGDYNVSNIHISPRTREIRIVDWEWAARGTPHADLVALVQGSDAELQQAALRTFSDQLGDYSPEEHERWYRWCLIERGLLDAAYLAGQHLGSERVVEWMPARIRRAVNQVLDTCAEMA